jgi:hypothetical protein
VSLAGKNFRLVEGGGVGGVGGYRIDAQSEILWRPYNVKKNQQTRQLIYEHGLYVKCLWLEPLRLWLTSPDRQSMEINGP